MVEFAMKYGDQSRIFTGGARKQENLIDHYKISSHFRARFHKTRIGITERLARPYMGSKARTQSRSSPIARLCLVVFDDLQKSRARVSNFER
jgi:hypothetical protein